MQRALSFLMGSLLGVQAFAASETLFPQKLTASLGKHSNQSISALSKQDQSGTADGWIKYIEFYPAKTGYAGDFSFKSSFKSLSKASLKANFKGLIKSSQTWKFSIYNQKTRQFEQIADNTGVKSWRWSAVSGSISLSSDFLSANQEVLVRYSTTSAQDNSDLDYLALTLEGSGSVVVPTEPTTPPTVPPTVPPTTPPTTGTWWKPAPGLSWDIQFSGNINYNVQVQAIDIDLFDTPQAKIDELKARGVKVICYFSAGSSEDWRPDYKDFPSIIKGKNLDGWPGENWLDVRNLDVVMSIMNKRFDLAVQKKCDAVDLDNMDIYLQNSGFSISYAQNLAYAKRLTQEAHKRKLSIGLKNNLEQIKDLVDDYDFAINEQCHFYNECHYMLPFVAKGKAVLGIEYDVATSKFCPSANANNFDFLKKNMSLDQKREACR